MFSNKQFEKNFFDGVNVEDLNSPIESDSDDQIFQENIDFIQNELEIKRQIQVKLVEIERKEKNLEKRSQGNAKRQLQVIRQCIAEKLMRYCSKHRDEFIEQCLTIIKQNRNFVDMVRTPKQHAVALVLAKSISCIVTPTLPTKSSQLLNDLIALIQALPKSPVQRPPIFAYASDN
jgi:hypothetical protein